MYPDLSYILADMFGTPVDTSISIVKTFGLLLALAFLGSAYTLSLELRRKEREGLLQASKVKTKTGGSSISEILFNGAFLFILGYKLPYLVANFGALKANPIGEVFSTNGQLAPGLILLIGWLLYALFRYVTMKEHGATVTKVIHPHERVTEITMLAAIFGILGAKLFVIIESKEAFLAFLQDPMGVLLSGRGLAIYGGLIVAFIAIMIYVGRLKFNRWHIVDAAAPALLIGYAIGRMGCHFSGDGDWGIVNALAQPAWWFLPDWVWAYDYPNTVLEHLNPEKGNYLVPIADCNGYETTSGEAPRYCKKLAKAVFPTPIYETTASLAIFSLLWSLRKRITVPGVIFFLYLIFNGIERFFIEKIRVNDKIDFLGMQLTQAEIISSMLFVIGVVGLIMRFQSAAKKSS